MLNTVNRNFINLTRNLILTMILGNIYTISVHILSEKNVSMIHNIAVNKIKNMVLAMIFDFRFFVMI